MRKFEYFLFENFDADEEAKNPCNPRSFLNQEADGLLAEVAQFPARLPSYEDCCRSYGGDLVRKLIDGGVLRLCGAQLSLDCPVLLREDADILHTEIAARAAGLIDLLQGGFSEIRSQCAMIDNGFPVEVNLYHILCGMVFDGRFFEYLCEKNALATSRLHPSGLDYLTVIYEKCAELQTLSDGLLCSYNRFVNAKCALQSFGDARGNRFDLYRFFRLREQGALYGKFKEAESLLLEDLGDASKDLLLDEAAALVQTGRCSPAALAVLERFGYAQNGAVCVPVYTPAHQKYIAGIEAIVELRLGKAMSDALAELSETVQITAVRHGVNRLEIANELYHIVFGSINEELVSRGLVSCPANFPEEGRYLKCIELY